MGSIRFILRIFFVLILIYIGIEELASGETEQPSLTVLMESTDMVPARESMKLWAKAVKMFQQSKAVKVIAVDPNRIFWPTLDEASRFTERMNVDYMLYVSLGKEATAYSYSAELVRPGDGAVLAMFKDSWPLDAASTNKAMFKLTSDAIYNSSGKITVNITIISSPRYADVYRGRDRLGDTGEAGFRKTYWWNKGQYEIKICKPTYRDYKETLKVEINPTDYQKQITLKRK